MKKKIIIILLLIGAVILVGVAGIFLFGNKRVNYDALTEVKLKSAAGMPYNGVELKLTLQDGTWVAYRRRYMDQNMSGELDEEISEKVVDDEFVQGIKKILSDNEVRKWDGFDKKDKHIMDGAGFTFDMRFSDGTEINAEGYMKYPDNYDEVYHAIAVQYEQLFGPIQYN